MTSSLSTTTERRDRRVPPPPPPTAAVSSSLEDPSPSALHLVLDPDDGSSRPQRGRWEGRGRSSTSYPTTTTTTTKDGGDRWREGGGDGIVVRVVLFVVVVVVDFVPSLGLLLRRSRCGVNLAPLPGHRGQIPSHPAVADCRVGLACLNVSLQVSLAT